MKTVEEVAWQIIREGLDPDWEAIDMKKITAIISADREDVLKRVEEGLKMIAWQAVEADPEKINTLCYYVVAAVKKEVCG